MVTNSCHHYFSPIFVTIICHHNATRERYSGVNSRCPDYDPALWENWQSTWSTVGSAGCQESPIVQVDATGVSLALPAITPLTAPDWLPPILIHLFTKSCQNSTKLGRPILSFLHLPSMVKLLSTSPSSKRIQSCVPMHITILNGISIAWVGYLVARLKKQGNPQCWCNKSTQLWRSWIFELNIWAGYLS